MVTETIVTGMPTLVLMVGIVGVILLLGALVAVRMTGKRGKP